MRRLVQRLFLAFVWLLVASSLSPGQILDRIVAVVNDDVVLESELNAQVQFFVFNNRVDPKTPKLKEQVLQSMINEKLIVAKAIEDSITVNDQEVQQRLDAVIQQRVQQVGTEARLEELYGMPLSRIKRESRDEMRNNLLAEKLQQQRFAGVKITRREVEEFLDTYKDSLGQIQEEVELAHIAIKLKPGKDAKAMAQAKAQSLLDSLKAGVDFGELARRHSDDAGSAASGGDLGWVRRGQFVKEFEAAVFALSEGEVSGIVETDFGLHIIELLERRGDAVHPRHILIRIERTQADRDSVIALLNTLRSRAIAGESFEALAKQYSDDKETAIIGGSLGTTELKNVDESFYSTIVNLKQGEISEPARLSVRGFDGYHIVLMKKRVPEHRPTLDGDYQRIEAIAMNYKQSNEYAVWLEDLKKNIYWESRL